MFENIIFKLLGSEKYDSFILYLNKDHKTITDFTKEIALFYTIFVISFIVLFVLDYILWYYLIIIILSLPIIFFCLYYYELFKENQRQKYIDGILQDILLQASLFPKGTEITKIIQYISEQDYKYISLEFRIALKQIKKGYSVTKSLQEICTRNKSKLLERVINLLIVGYKSGKDMHFVFNKISQYILHIQELERERYSSLAIQKYTLLVSAAILVPLILGWIQNIIAGFDFSSFQNIGVIKIDSNLQIYAKYATWIYLFELSAISSYFVALIDGNKKKSIIYFLIILPVSLLIFFFV
jgi:hypothetical protein